MPRATRSSKPLSQGGAGSIGVDYATYSSKNTVAQIKDALNVLEVEVPSNVRLKKDLLELLLSSVSTSDKESKKTKNSNASEEEVVEEIKKLTRGRKKGSTVTKPEVVPSRRSRRDVQSQEEGMNIDEKPTRATRHTKAKPTDVANNNTRKSRRGDKAEANAPIAKDVKRWENEEDDDEDSDEEEKEGGKGKVPSPKKRGVAAKATATRSRASSRSIPVAIEKERAPLRRKRSHQSSDEESQDGNELVRRGGRDRSISATAKPIAKKSKKSTTPPPSPSPPRRNNLRNERKLPKNGWVEEDVIREHLGEKVEMDAPIARDVRRWHNEDDNVELTGSRFGHYSKQDASPSSRRSSSRSKSPVKTTMTKNTKSNKKGVVVSSRTTRRMVGVTKDIKAPSRPVRGTRRGRNRSLTPPLPSSNDERSLTPRLPSSSGDDDMDEESNKDASSSSEEEEEEEDDDDDDEEEEEEAALSSGARSARRKSELLSSVNAALSGKKISKTEYKAALQLLNSAKEEASQGEDDSSDNSGDDERGSPSSLLASATAAYEALESMEQQPEGIAQKRDRVSIGGQWTSRESFLPPSPKQSRRTVNNNNNNAVMEAGTVATNAYVNSGTATSRTALPEPPATIFRNGGRLSGSGASPYTQKGPFGAGQYYPQTEIRNMPSGGRGDVSHAAMTTARKAQRISSKLDAAFSAPMAKQYSNKQSIAPTPGMAVGLGHMSMGLNRSGYLSNRSSFGSQVSGNSRLKMSPGSALSSYTPHFKENSVRFDPGDSLSGNKPLSLVQRRRKMRQSEGGVPQSSSKSAIMAKRILETLSDLQGPIEQSRKAPVTAPWETRRYSTNGIGNNMHITTKKVEPPVDNANGHIQQSFNIQGNADATGNSVASAETLRTSRKEYISDYNVNAPNKSGNLSIESSSSSLYTSNKNTVTSNSTSIGGPFKSSAVAATMGTDSSRGSRSSSVIEKAQKKSRKTPIVQDIEYPFTEASDDNDEMDASADSSRIFTFSQGTESSATRVKLVADLKLQGDKEVQKTISDAAPATGDKSGGGFISKSSSNAPVKGADTTSTNTPAGSGIQANSAWARALASNDISCPHCFQMQPPSHVKCDSCDNYLKCPHCDVANIDAVIDVCPACNKKFVEATGLPSWAAKKPAATPAPASAPEGSGIKFGGSTPAPPITSTGDSKPFAFGSKPANAIVTTEKRDGGVVPAFGGSKSTALGTSNSASSSTAVAPLKVPTFGAKSDKGSSSGDTSTTGGTKFGGFSKPAGANADGATTGTTSAANDASKPALSFGSKTTDSTSTSAGANSGKTPFSFGSSSGPSNAFAKAGQAAAADKSDNTDKVSAASKPGGILSRLGARPSGEPDGRGPPDDGPTKKAREVSRDDSANPKPFGGGGGFKFGGPSASTAPSDNLDGGEKKKPFVFGGSNASDDAPHAAVKVPSFAPKSENKDAASASNKAPFTFGNKDKSDGAVAAATLTSLGDGPAPKPAFSFGKKDEGAGALGALDDAPTKIAGTTEAKPFKFGASKDAPAAPGPAPFKFGASKDAPAANTAAPGPAPFKFGASKDAPAANTAAPGPTPFKFGANNASSDDKKAGDALVGLASGTGTTFKAPTFGKKDTDKSGDSGTALIFGAPSSNTISGSKSDGAPAVSAPAPFKFGTTASKSDSAPATGSSSALPAVNNMFGSSGNVAPLNSSNLEKISGKEGLAANTGAPGPFGGGVPPLPNNTGSESPGSAMDMGYNSGDNSNISAPSGTFGGNTAAGSGAAATSDAPKPFTFGGNTQPTFPPPTFGSNGTQAPMFGGGSGSQPFGSSKSNTNLVGIGGGPGIASSGPLSSAPFQFGGGNGGPTPNPAGAGGGGGFSMGSSQTQHGKKKLIVRRKK